MVAGVLLIRFEIEESDWDSNPNRKKNSIMMTMKSSNELAGELTHFHWKQSVQIVPGMR